ncbi:MAG: hypothetical protein MR379_00270 [Clostridiales bacterium]|nr:hypothetical protein [Clostridiales bacterium]
MNKQLFLDELGAHLASLGADEKTVASQKAKMDAYLRSKNMEDIDVDPGKMAEGIMEKLRAESAGSEPESSAADIHTSAPSSAAGKEKARPAPAIMDKLRSDKQRPSASGEENNGGQKAASDVSPSNDPLSALDAKPRRSSPAEHSHTPETEKQEAAQRAEKNAPNKRPESVAVSTKTPPKPVPANHDQADDDFESDGEVKSSAISKNRTLYTVLFCLAIPLAAILAVVVAAAFLGLVFILAAIAILFVLALIVIVAAGCSVALIGIIYGAYKIVTGLVPVGMYEIGLGITIGGIVMFVGIIMYNIAIRLVPYLMKKLAQLVGFAFKSTRDGFIAMKGALEKL